MRERRREEETKGFRRAAHQRQYSTRTPYAKGAYAAHVPAGGKALTLCLLNNILGSTSRLDTGRARNPSRGSASVIARLLTFAASVYQQKSSALNRINIINFRAFLNISTTLSRVHEMKYSRHGYPFFWVMIFTRFKTTIGFNFDEF